ncbi:lipoprotein [Amphritea sp.]|uniref:lipoprotein n=1 Tax=Amphritea sp. TaxID=1872502 RepID=UPI0025C6FBEB|nr:lipoprotein [Amphritea sp.]
MKKTVLIFLLAALLAGCSNMGEKASLSLLAVVAVPIAVATSPLIVAEHIREKSGTYWGISEHNLLEKIGEPENVYFCNNGQFYIWEYNNSETIEEDKQFIFISDGTVRETAKTFKYSTLCSLKTEQSSNIEN